MPKLRRGFAGPPETPKTLVHIAIIAVICLLIGILVPAISKARESIRKSQAAQPQSISQEEKDRRLQEATARAEQRRAEQLQKEAQEEQERLQLIEKEKQQQEILQREYLSQVQPLNFTVTPWQYNREQEFSVFILYDITNKQEYIVIKTGLGTPSPSISITPRYKNLNP